MTHYRQRIFDEVKRLIEPLGVVDSALDFGSGDGFYASQWSNGSIVRTVTPVDVVERKNSIVVPTLYDGDCLPFPDRSFVLAYAIDVLHHCHDPGAALRDLMRCSSKFLLLKDHTYESRVGKLTLGLLDEIGNRRFGIPSPYLYQYRWTWVEEIEASGWRRISFSNPMRCHTGILGAVTNSLQFIGLWERDRALV
jgi:hypothetical protein